MKQYPALTLKSMSSKLGNFFVNFKISHFSGTFQYLKKKWRKVPENVQIYVFHQIWSVCNLNASNLTQNSRFPENNEGLKNLVFSSKR